MLDMFGNPFPVTKPRVRCRLDRAHAALVGSGPRKETCRTCAHLARKHMARTYLKCGLMRSTWTGGPGTDVRAKDPACSKWKKRS